jgi:hypothetical protein
VVGLDGVPVSRRLVAGWLAGRYVASRSGLGVKVNQRLVSAVADLSANVGPALQDRPSPVLPDDHIAFLEQINGATAYHGAFRLFGYREDSLGLERWNATSTWRFAWGERADNYLFFGETAFGDQYAYRIDPAGYVSDSTIYFLQSALLTPVVIADSFETFLEEEFLRNARAPYDGHVLQVIHRSGGVGPDSNWVYSPSVVLGGPDDPANVVQLPSDVAMTYQGDIVTAIYARPDETLNRVTPWTDELGRPRLRLDLV